ncbi:hypothetical protein LINGRAHAP2_LOCUS23136 [Linum grandiflorum]
MGGSSFSHLS